jgi:hypothetical protein
VANGTQPLPPGSLFLIRNTDTDFTHTGVVIGLAGDTFETIEGNTNDSGDHDGFEVCRRTRRINKVDFVAL